MGELRKDYILEEYVIIAIERVKRPDQFKHVEAQNKATFCPFCKGNEDKTPPETFRIDKDGAWQIRVFENKFGAVHQKGTASLQTHDRFFTFSDNYGKHEVIVESPFHDRRIWDFDEENILNIFRAYCNRIDQISNDPLIHYVECFKNSGKEAATSIIHPHSQVIGISKIPQRILEKEKCCKEYQSCPYCDIMEIEKQSERRAFENESFVAFTPYASRYNFEIWVFPKRHVISILELDEKELADLAKIYKQIVNRLKELNAPFNMCLQNGIERMHFHMEIKPRLSKYAGFELGTDMIINIVSPEQAAKFYRGED